MIDRNRSHDKVHERREVYSMILDSSPWLLLVAVPVVAVLVGLEVYTRKARARKSDPN